MGQKVSFEGNTKIITITQAPDANGDVTIDVKQDLYSDGKEDWVATEGLRRFQFPIQVDGGRSLPGGKKSGSFFFLDSSWKIQPYFADHRLIIRGDLFATDGSDYILTVPGYTVKIIQDVSALVVAGAMTQQEHDQIMSLGTSNENAQAVLDSIIDDSGPTNLKKVLKAIVAVLCGKASGGGSEQITFRNMGDDDYMLIMNVDEDGNRLSVVMNDD